MACVYKLTRADGLEYIGITKKLKKRLWSHKRSNRFKDSPIADLVILFEGTYEECDTLEEKYIEKYGTFRHGLNMTNRGKGKNLTDRFNTLGYKFSAASRNKMSESSKRRVRETGYKHSEDTKAAWSELRKGKAWGPIKIDPVRVVSEWNAFSPAPEDMMHLIAPKTIGTGTEMFRNGKEFSYERGKLALFKRSKSEEYSVSPQAIFRVLSNASCI